MFLISSGRGGGGGVCYAERKLRFEDSEVTMRFRLASFFLRRLSTDVISLSRELYRRRGSFFFASRTRSIARRYLGHFLPRLRVRSRLACLPASRPFRPELGVFFAAEHNSSV